MANWSQKKLLLTIGGGALVVCGAAAGGVYYTHTVMDDIAVEIAAKQSDLLLANGKIARIPAIEKEVIILRENLDEYVKILPDTRELPDFVRMLNQFERQSGVYGTGLSNKNSRRGQANGRFTPIEYTYEMTATLWQALKFMNLIENYERFVSITNFRIDTGRSMREREIRDGEAVHKVKVTMLTFTYNAAGTGKDVEIPNYADRREELREEIWNRMQAIRIDRYEHRGVHGRRDIFVDPRERGDLTNEGPSQAEQRAVLEKHIGAIDLLNTMLTRIRADDTTLFEQYALKRRFKTDLASLMRDVEDDAGQVSYRPYTLRWAKEVVAPIDHLKQQIDSAEAIRPREVDPFLPETHIRQLVAEMAEDCNNGLLEQACERYEAVRDRIGVPASDPRHELAVLAKRWQIKATMAIAFKALDLNVQGVVVNHGGRSGVLLNGEVYEEGDYVADDLLIKQVEEEQVWFVFRGLTLVRKM